MLSRLLAYIVLLLTPLFVIHHYGQEKPEDLEPKQRLGDELDKQVICHVIRRLLLANADDDVTCRQSIPVSRQVTKSAG